MHTPKGWRGCFDDDQPARRDGDLELRDAIHRIALEWPS
jgi:hypothetical protein